MKTLYKILLGGFLFTLDPLSVAAQTISATTYPFTSSTGATLDNMSAGTTQVVGPNVDESTTILKDIGFDFWYNGTRYTQFAVSVNGYIRPGTTVASPGTDPDYTNNLGSANQAPAIAPYWDDIYTGISTGKVHYKVTGSAPNRKLTVEWFNIQIPRVGNGAAGAGVFQLWIWETTGIIEFVYGSGVILNLTSLGASIGINASATVFASVTASSNTCSYSVVNDMNTAAITSGTKYTFTPLIPADPSLLSFTSVTLTAMTLNWVDNATDEVGYAIYRSDDAGLTYNFINQVAANSVSSIQSLLVAGTNYFWKIFAVTEGGLSGSLQGNQATLAAVNISSNGTGGGNWSSTLSWAGGILPGNQDNVIIRDGDVITIDIAADAYSLTVGEGLSGILEYEAGTARTLTVVSSVVVAPGGTLSSGTGAITTHVLSVERNITNNGIIDLASGTSGAGLTFTGVTNSTFTGTGATTNLFTLLLSKSTISQILDVNLTNFSVRGLSTAATGALLTSGTGTGTLKFSGTNTFSGTLWNTAGYSIPATFAFWLNNPNFNVAGQNGSPGNSGVLRITQGTFNAGTATNNVIGAGAGASFIIEGGIMNVAGRFSMTPAITYTQSGGAVNVCTVGNNAATTPSFLLNAGTFNMSGGSITIVQINSNATPTSRRDYHVIAVPNITGGTLYFGTGSTTGNSGIFDYRVYGYVPNMAIDNTTNNKTVTAGFSTGLGAGVNVLIAHGDLTINTGTTYFVANYTSILLRNLVNNGTLIGNTVNGRLTFSGSVPQTYSGNGIAGTNASPLLSFEVNNTAGVTIDPSVTNNIVTNRVILFRGGFTNSNKITLGSGGASTATVQIGNTTTPFDAGNFDVAPVFNLGTGGQNILYLRFTNPRSTGPEINPTRVLTNLTMDNNVNSLTLAGGDLVVRGNYTQTNGNIDLGANTLTLGTSAVSPGTFTYAAGTLIGKFRRWITAATGNRDFPVGTTSVKRNASINFTTMPATGGTLTAQWIRVAGGSNGLPLTEGAITVNTTSREGFWSVVAGDGLTGGMYTGSFTATGIADVNDYTQLVLIKRADASSPWTLDGTHVTTTGSNAIPVLSRTGMTGFSEFGTGGDFLINPLPITLLSFTAQRNGNVNVIKWSTSQEINSSHFILQRSNDGRNFTAIAQLAAAGNSSSIRNYNYTDNNPVKGIYYYRLLTVDMDNSSKYSLIRRVRNEGIADVAVYPNPVKDILNVTISADKAGKGSMMITGMNGKLVYNKAISVAQGNNNLAVDLGGFASGAYIIKVQLIDDIIIKTFNKL
jgi:hypothetical protein